MVPFGFDGAADRAARAFADLAARDAGPIAVENVPGEGGLAGVRRANALAREAGDSVLLLGTPSTHILLPARLGTSAAPDAALRPRVGLGSAPNVLLASSRLGVRSVPELVARARTQRLVYASAGAGQTIHVCTAYFCALAGIAMTHRSYDAGSAHAYADLAAGRVHVHFDNVLACGEAIGRGDVVALAVSARTRNRLLPDVPTLGECGFPEHELDIWFGVFGAGPGVDALSKAGDHALAAAMVDRGLSGGLLRPDALEAQMRESETNWRRALAMI